jgi:RNA polymerase sigma-70 factor (ECF subfamily)
MSALANAAEAAVVALATTGDQAAFDELVRRNQSRVRSLMRHLSRDAANAEDLAQQVFVEMWKSLSRLKTTAAFNGWLRQIGVNVWLQHARKKDTSLHNLTNSLDEMPIATSDESAQGSCIDLAAALALLPGPVRLCIVLAYQEGMSHGEIVASTNIPLGTVKSHIARGSARLRELLKDYGASS